MARIEKSRIGSILHLVLTGSDIHMDAQLQEQIADNYLKLLNDKTY